MRPPPCDGTRGGQKTWASRDAGWSLLTHTSWPPAPSRDRSLACRSEFVTWAGVSGVVSQRGREESRKSWEMSMHRPAKHGSDSANIVASSTHLGPRSAKLDLISANVGRTRQKISQVIAVEQPVRSRKGQTTCLMAFGDPVHPFVILSDVFFPKAQNGQSPGTWQTCPRRCV